MKRKLSILMAIFIAASAFNFLPVLGYKDATPWFISFNNTGDISLSNASGSDRVVKSQHVDPYNGENYLGIIKSESNFATAGDIGLYKTLAGNQGAFYNTTGVSASAGSGVNKMDLYFEDMAVVRKTAPRFASVKTDKTFAISGFHNFNIFFDTDGNVKQNYQETSTSTVDLTESTRTEIGSYETGKWYRLVQKIDTARQVLEINVYDLANEQNPFSEERIKDVNETFESAPVATGKYYVGYGGLEGHSLDTGDRISKGTTILGQVGVYITSTVPANTQSTLYVDNMMAGPSFATAKLAVVDTTNQYKAVVLDENAVLPFNFIGRMVQLRLSQPIQNNSSITSIGLKKVSTGEIVNVSRNMTVSGDNAITDETAPQIIELNIPNDLEANASYEFILNGIHDIHGQSFQNLKINCITPEFLADLQMALNNLGDYVSQQNGGLNLESVRGNIILPQMTDSGVSINWTNSSDPSMLSTDGTTVCPPYSEFEDLSKSVTLTAVLSKNGISLTTQLNFVVKMQDAAPEFYILKAAYEHFGQTFKIKDGIITSPIMFPETFESPDYKGNPVNLSYTVKGREATTDERAQNALKIEKGTSKVNRIMGIGEDVYANIEVVFSLEGAAERYLTIPVTIPHKNLLSDIALNELTDARPTVWNAQANEEKIIKLGKKMVIGSLQAVGTGSDRARFYISEGGKWQQADLPAVASEIKIVMSDAGSLEEIEAYVTDEDIAKIDILNTEIKDNLNGVTESIINLPFVGEFGTKLAWISSNPSVIDQFGVVTRKSTNQTVILTVTPKEVSLPNLTKSFTITVNKKDNPPSGGGGGGGGGGSSLNVTVPITTPAPEVPADPKEIFNDISDAKWAEEYIEHLAGKGILNGRGNNLFSPNDSILREEFVKVVLLAFDIKSEDKNISFADVSGDRWYHDYIITAASAGIVKGHDGKFGIGEKITRQDMAVMLQRAANYVGAELKNKNEIPQFEDLSLAREDAKEAIVNLAKAGILGGYSDNTIKPQNFATRAETAKMVYGVLESTGRLR